MALSSKDFLKLLNSNMQPIFLKHGYKLARESGVKLWQKQLDEYGDYRAAITYEKMTDHGINKFCFRLYVSDGNFFDIQSFRKSYIPSAGILKKMEIRKSKIDLLIGDDWLRYPNTTKEHCAIALRLYAEELIDIIDKTVPKAIKWLKR